MPRRASPFVFTVAALSWAAVSACKDKGQGGVYNPYFGPYTEEHSGHSAYYPYNPYFPYHTGHSGEPPAPHTGETPETGVQDTDVQDTSGPADTALPTGGTDTGDTGVVAAHRYPLSLPHRLPVDVPLSPYASAPPARPEVPEPAPSAFVVTIRRG